MECSWKKNWEETKNNYRRWWNREGLVIGMWGGPKTDRPNETVERLSYVPDQGTEEYYTKVDLRVGKNHHVLANQCFPADIIPVPNTFIGPGSLAMHLGSEPEFRKESVWFHPSIKDVSNPEKLSPFTFDPESKWWKIQEETLKKSVELGRGKYIVGCPDLIENIDILASLRETSTLFMDMVERPDWVVEKVGEINRAFFDAYSRIYDIIQLEDGSSVYEAYMLWGPGKTAKIQCDAAAMFSPAMFRKFVVPAMTEQCEWLDYSMYHLDGREEFCHLEALFEIEALDAIEWTPNAGEPLGGDPKWYDLYRKILDAGKSLQVYLVWANEIVPLLDAIGGKGVYVLAIFNNEAEVETVLKNIEQFR
ncbi:MAG: hypothetical protein GY866_22420 [Proteobacteria bacterium]|nr:hypothetical protein [Pseudomonadota bacterium]